MESFYSFDNFFRLIASLAILVLLIPSALKLPRNLRILSAAVAAVPVLGVLIPITPFPKLAEGFTFLFILLLPLLPLWLFFVVRYRRHPRIAAYKEPIFETLRDSVFIFDTSLRLLGQGGLQAESLKIDKDRFLNHLKGFIAQDPPRKRYREKELRFDGRVLQCRYQRLRRGYLMTVKDITERQELIDNLVVTNQSLEKRQAILKATESIEPAERRERIRREISGRIMALVREKLDVLQRMAALPARPEELVKEAEETLDEIRTAVDQLNPQRRTE